MTEDELIASLRKRNGTTKFDVNLLMIALTCTDEMTQERVKLLVDSTKQKMRMV